METAFASPLLPPLLRGKEWLELLADNGEEVEMERIADALAELYHAQRNVVPGETNQFLHDPAKRDSYDKHGNKGPVLKPTSSIEIEEESRVSEVCIQEIQKVLLCDEGMTFEPRLSPHSKDVVCQRIIEGGMRLIENIIEERKLALHPLMARPVAAGKERTGRRPSATLDLEDFEVDSSLFMTRVTYGFGNAHWSEENGVGAEGNGGEGGGGEGERRLQQEFTRRQ